MWHNEVFDDDSANKSLKMVPIHGFKNIDSTTATAKNITIVILIVHVVMFLVAFVVDCLPLHCIGLVIQAKHCFFVFVYLAFSSFAFVSVPLLLFSFIWICFGSFAFVLLVLPLFRFLCHGKVLRLAIRFSHGWGRRAKEWSDRKEKKRRRRSQNCSEVHVIQGNWKIIVKQISFLSPLKVIKHDSGNLPGCFF